MHEWMDAYREIGFEGPDSYDTMSARIGGVDFTACQMPGKIVAVVGTWSTADSSGFREIVCDATWDARRLLEALSGLSQTNQCTPSSPGS